MTHRVLISCHHLQKKIDAYRDVFASNGIDIELPPSTQQLNEPDLLEIIDRFDGVIAGDDQFTGRVLEKAGKLKILVKWGVGVDAIDLAAASRLGIPVRNTPNVFGDEVADVTMGYILLLARKLHLMDRSVREGGWLKIQGMTLRDKTAGIIGFGDIGRSLARRVRAHGMKVKVYDVVTVKPETLAETGATQDTLDDLLAGSDIVALCCNLTPANRHMIAAGQFALMKKGSFLVNTARGPLVDEPALAAALRDGTLAGAALDVFEEEPLPPGSPLRTFEGCIFGTHNGSNTLEAVKRVNDISVQYLLEGLRGDRT